VLFRLVSDHLHRLQTACDDCFARIRCDACTREYLLAFSCKCRHFCPSCHAKRLASWRQFVARPSQAEGRFVRMYTVTAAKSVRPTLSAA
jgi:hypothetical protein